MQLRRAGSQPSGKGPSDWFTGTVRIDPLFPATPPARAAGNAVTFEPGARTAWHTHPLGQTLIVISGAGRVQRLGGPIEEIRPGDVVWFDAGREALARGFPDNCHDARRDPGGFGRQVRRVDGARHQRRVRRPRLVRGKPMRYAGRLRYRRRQWLALSVAALVHCRGGFLRKLLRSADLTRSHVSRPARTTLMGTSAPAGPISQTFR